MALETFKVFYQRHRRWVPIGFFTLGFVFDAFMLRRIDERSVILQQAAYLFISALLIGMEITEGFREIHPPLFLKPFWKYREALLHFLLGTLLNSYTIFYFKSASAFSSFLYIAILVAVLILNEFHRFGKRQTLVHTAFLGLCTISYFVSLVPILLGFVGDIPFLIANAVAIVLFAVFYWIVRPKRDSGHRSKQNQIWLPFAVTQLVFGVLYFVHAIPPVPLSVSYLGIYHDVKKVDGDFKLTSYRPKWKFWQHGDQTFVAGAGDAIYCFARIFSPSRFKDKLQVRWLFYDDKRGWQTTDVVPMDILGGREAGYRGVSYKRNYRSGSWRVQVETLDNREVGRIRFSVEDENDENARDREVSSEVQ